MSRPLLGFWLVARPARLTAFELHRVATELLAQRGDHLRGEGLWLARDEALQERERNHGRGHVLIYRGLHRPAPLAGVLDIATNAGERRIFLERVRRQIEQPRAY